MELPIGNYIDIFGSGFNPIPDTWGAIAPYKYHLFFENDVISDYWTKKLADAFLGFAYPIYFGCPNICDYFDENSILRIEIHSFDNAVAILTDLILIDPYEIHFESIIVARNKVLNDYNLFQLMALICQKTASKYTKCTLNPNTYYTDSFFKNLVRNVVYKKVIKVSLQEIS